MHTNSLGPEFPRFETLDMDDRDVLATILSNKEGMRVDEIMNTLGWFYERITTCLQRLKISGLVVDDDGIWRQPVLFWTDLETTGLDENFNIVLEVGVVVTTTDLTELAHLSHVVYTPEINHYMSPRVVEMHTANGLFNEIRNRDIALDRDTLVRRFLDFLSKWGGKGKVPMCGSTIDFDRRFMGKHLSEIVAHFHYRSINVSSFREIAKLWKPSVYETLPTKKDNQESRHRVIDDCRDSIAQLKHYRKYLLNVL